VKRSSQRRAQPAGHRVAGEVGLDKPHVGRVEAEPFEPLELVPLGRGMVDLEPADARLGVPERAAVIASRAHHDLRHAAAGRAGNGPVEERGARGQVIVHPAGRGLPPGRHVDGQRVIRGGVTVVSGDPGEVQAVRRHPASGLRWAPVLHVSSFWHGQPMPR